MTIYMTDSDPLRELSSLLKLSTEIIKKRTTTVLKLEGIYYGDAQDCGMTVENIVKDSGYDLEYIFTKAFTGLQIIDETLIFFGALQYVGSGDCPECGNDLHKEIDGDSLYEWVIESCSCGYQNTTDKERITYETYYSQIN